MVGAVDGVALHGEEDRIGHRRVIPLAAEVIAVHAERGEGAVRRVVTGNAGRHRPDIHLLAVLADGHSLGGFVDLNQEVGARRRGGDKGERGERRKQGG